MHLLLLLSSLLLSASHACAGPIAATSQEAQTSTSTWSIMEYRIACTQSACLYSFDITEKSDNQQLQQQQDSSHCEFTVVAGTAALPANRTSFQDKACSDDKGPSYSVNGGFMNATGAVILCFKKAPEDNWAFFGFDTWEFLSGPQKTSPAYPIGTWDNSTEETIAMGILSL
ncbi:hypothetical protein PG994_002901 [Apiospora phragmitis]|uniref:AA1-like domain-containing protein n=1 Tax=Apiospora phragmitis TaxID=2905665 RepID=A0ABR1W6I4_9PEZI